jgi:Divergent InlB B-repeat domain
MEPFKRLAFTLIFAWGLTGPADAQVVPIWWNNLYYQKGSEFLVLTGHGGIAPTDPTYSDTIATLASNSIRYARVWHMCGDVDHRPWDVTWDPEEHQYIFWFGVWKEDFWAQFRRALSLARDNGIVAEVHLFDRSGVGWDPLDIRPCEGGKGLFYNDAGYKYWFDGAGRAILEQYVDKLITETHDFDNVIYEVDQESVIPLPGWHAHWAQFVKDKLESLGSERSRVVAITPPSDVIPALGHWSLDDVDTINLHSDKPRPDLSVGELVSYLQRKRAEIRSVRGATGKAVCHDEFGNGMDVEDHLRMMAWTFLTSGAHFHIEQAEPGIALRVAGDVERWKGTSYWEFWRFSPSDEPRLSGGLATFCMKGYWPATGATEYLCYVPAVPLGSNSIGVTLPQPPAGYGNWGAVVWNPREVDAGGHGPFYSASPTFLAAALPSSDPVATRRDWVLHIYSNAGPTYALTVTRGGTGAGTVTSSPGGIDCGLDCTESYTIGTVVSLSASPAAGSRFVGWGGDCSGGASPCQVTVSQARSVSAIFEALPTYPLTVTLAGAGSGTVTSSPAGIACDPDCSGSYPPGTIVTLREIPGPASTFTGWSGACSGAQASCQVTMDAAQSVTASFAPFPGLLYNPLPLPCRVLDTRSQDPLAHGHAVSIPVAGSCGVPGAAQAVATTVVAVNPTAPGFIAMNSPTISTAVANFPLSGDAWASSALASLSGGSVSAAAYLADLGTTHLVMDVSGYFVPDSLGGQFYRPLIPPARLVDTRSEDDPLPAETKRIYETAGFGRLPADATALALSASIVTPQDRGHLKLYPADGGFPNTSFLNYRSADLIGNGGIVAVSGATGRLAAWSSQTLHLILDVHGAFVLRPARPARRYFPITPCRVLDTRATGQRFSGSLSFPVGGTCGIPADAVAVAANFAVVDPSASGHLRLSPAGYAPVISQLLYQAGWTVSSGALVSLGAGGHVTAIVPSTTDLVFDVTGYFR